MKRFSIAVLLAFAASAASAQDLKEGQWEYQTTINGAGGPQLTPEQRAQLEAAKAQMPPGFKMPGMEFGAGGGITTTFKKCVTKEDLLPPQREEPGVKCEVTRQERSGNRVEFAARCKGKDTDMTSDGWAEYSGSSMKSEVKARGTTHGQPVDMSISTAGKYLGACGK